MAYLKLWDNILDSSKAQGLPGELFKWWINLLAAVNREGGANGELPPKMSLVFATRMSAKVIKSRLDKLVRRGLLDPIDKNPIGGELFKVHDWTYWQQPKDVKAAERQKRYRERCASRYAQRNGENHHEDSQHHVENDVTVTSRDVPPLYEGNEEYKTPSLSSPPKSPARNPPPADSATRRHLNLPDLSEVADDPVIARELAAREAARKRTEGTE